MQDTEKILYDAVAKVIKRQRKLLGKPFTIFYYENDIPTTTLGCIENARRKVHLFVILKAAEALGLSCIEFFKPVQKELPRNFSLNKLD